MKHDKVLSPKRYYNAKNKIPFDKFMAHKFVKGSKPIGTESKYFNKRSVNDLINLELQGPIEKSMKITIILSDNDEPMNEEEEQK